MNINQFLSYISRRQQLLDQLVNRILPIKVGVEAKAHFQQNFIKGGFVNNGLKRWTPAKRTTSNNASAQSNYKTLLSSRNHLFSSINYTPGSGMVTITNTVPYAAMHNQGFIGGVSVRPFHRKTKASAVATNIRSRRSFQTNRAQVQGHTRRVKMPKRQFIGESAELNNSVKNIINTEFRKIINP